MSEKMYPIPFRSLMNWILAEREKTGDVFGVHKRWIADPAKTLPIFGEKIETPVWPRCRPEQPAGAEYHRRLRRRRALL